MKTFGQIFDYWLEDIDKNIAKYSDVRKRMEMNNT